MGEKKMFFAWFLVIAVILGGWYIFNSSSEGNITENSMANTSIVKTESDSKNKTNNNDYRVVSISEVNRNMIGERVVIQGDIIERREHNNGHLFLKVSEGNHKIDVPIFADKPINHENLVLNQKYFFSGVVEEYNGNLQIVPENQDDVISANSQHDNHLVTKDNIGKRLVVQGTVLSNYKNADGHVFLNLKLDNQDKEITIPIFNTINYDNTNLSINSIIRVEGELSLYSNQLQVIPEKVQDIEIVALGNDEEIELVDIKDISRNLRGQMKQVRGEVLDYREVNGHLFFDFVQDGSKINAVLFRAEGTEIIGRAKRIKDSKGNYPIRILAMVDIYNDNLQLIVTKVYNEY